MENLKASLNLDGFRMIYSNYSNLNTRTLAIKLTQHSLTESNSTFSINFNPPFNQTRNIQ